MDDQLRVGNRPRRTRWTTVRMSALAGATLLLACKDDYPAIMQPVPEPADAGTRDGGRVDDASSYICPPPDGSSECSSCFGDSCCQELGALQNDGEMLWDCVVDCDASLSCQNTCMSRFPKLAPLLRGFNACADANCKQACIE